MSAASGPGNDDVRVRAEDFIPDVRRKPVVDAENHDQRGDAYGHAKHGTLAEMM